MKKILIPLFFVIMLASACNPPVTDPEPEPEKVPGNVEITERPSPEQM